MLVSILWTRWYLIYYFHLQYILVKEPLDSIFFELAYNLLYSIPGGDDILKRELIMERAKFMKLNNYINVY